jgi:hypothetical protein
MSIPQVRQYFFNNCHGFSLMYEVLASKKGEEFRKECKELNKEICAWTVNGKEEMRECVRWGVKSIISDKPDQWRAIKKDILANRKAALKPTLTTYVLPYLQKKNYWFEYVSYRGLHPGSQNADAFGSNGWRTRRQSTWSARPASLTSTRRKPCPSESLDLAMRWSKD